MSVTHKSIVAIVALSGGLMAYGAASSEVGGSNAIPPLTESRKLTFAVVCASAIGMVLTYGPRGIGQVPRAERRRFWWALAGRFAACLLFWSALSLAHALALAFGPGRYLTAGDWIVSRALIATLLTFIPWAMIVTSRYRPVR